VNAHFPLLWLSLYRRRRLLLALSLGLVAFESMIVVVATLMSPADLLAQKGADTGSFDAFAGSSGDVELASIAGLLGAGLLHPFWIALQLSAVGSLGAALMAADIEDGTIELIAVRPISRARILGERLGAMVAAVIVLGFIAVTPYAVAVLTSGTISDALGVKGIIAAGIAGIALVLAFTGIATFASCVLRRRSAVFATVGGIAAISYALNFIAETWNDIEATRLISLFHYYQPADALVFNRYDAANLTVLLGTFAITTIAAFVVLQRRDLTR
jgi:ABC-2 type transport system permease protein